MLTAYHVPRRYADAHQGIVLDAGGVRWTIGAHVADSGGTYRIESVYEVTADRSFCIDAEGKHRKIAGAYRVEAIRDHDPDTLDRRWTIVGTRHDLEEWTIYARDPRE